jgi:PAS domain S-box-containing protein
MELSKPRVVLIHRNPDRAAELKLPLESGGMEVFTAQDTKGGIALARKGGDIVILDMALSDDRLRLCRTFRQDKLTSGIPILALSETPLAENEIHDILSGGAMDVLDFPFSPPLLLARVGNLVRIHREEVQLKETEQRYRRIFTSSHYGYFLSSREGRFLEINDALMNILGYSKREDMLRLRLPDDLYVNPEDREIMQTLIEKQGFVKDFKVDFKRKDGSVVTILMTANLYRSPDGQTVGYEGFNIPLMDLKLPFGTRVLSILLKSFQKIFKKKRNFLTVSRITEMVANQYEKTEELSEGIYTSVWKGRDVLGFEESPLIIKISRSEAINPRLLVEAQVLRELAGHPGIPELVDVARHRGRTVLVMRYIEGTPLSAALETLKPKDRDRIAYQLMDVVAHLHNHNVVHRDIKPDNIIVRPDGGVALLDYGIVRQMEQMETSATVIGTRPYMSPEQVNGKSERRSDIWAIGVVLYQMYTGRLPFYGNTEMELMENILHKEVVVPRALNPDITAQMEEILLRSLRKNPDGRFTNAMVMRETIVSQVPGFKKNVKDLIPEEEPLPLVP